MLNSWKMNRNLQWCKLYTMYIYIKSTCELLMSRYKCSLSHVCGGTKIKLLYLVPEAAELLWVVADLSVLVGK